METTNETKVVEGDYENPWTYQGSTFTSADIDDFFGFVYRITNLQTANNTSVENTSTKNVNLEVVRDGLRLKVTGSDTMEVLKNLIQIESFLETQRSNEKSSPYMPGSGM